VLRVLGGMFLKSMANSDFQVGPRTGRKREGTAKKKGGLRAWHGVPAPPNRLNRKSFLHPVACQEFRLEVRPFGKVYPSRPALSNADGSKKGPLTTTRPSNAGAAQNELRPARKITHRNVCRIYEFNRIVGVPKGL